MHAAMLAGSQWSLLGLNGVPRLLLETEVPAQLCANAPNFDPPFLSRSILEPILTFVYKYREETGS
jgi:hypothetical protein